MASGGGTDEGMGSRADGPQAQFGGDQSGAQEDVVDKDSLTLYPERRGEGYDPGLAGIGILGHRGPKLEKLKCEQNIMTCVEKSPLVKLMLSALKSAGCEIDYRRHFSCEMCGPEVTGGYDPALNQVVICYNRATYSGIVQGVVAHELLHMFDFCRSNLDFNNLEHIACTEIRAANLMHCSFLSSLFQGSSSPFHIRQSHRDCVKAKAMASIVAVRPQMEREKAWKIVDKVFDKCYNDLEPVGRRLRRTSDEMEYAYRERFHYGYY
jgi:inner membrane protease ATP23